MAYTSYRRTLTIIVIFTCILPSCIPPQQPPPSNPFLKNLKENTNLAETGQALPYFTTYVEEMDKLGLSGIFTEKGPYTLFIPRTEAFAKFLKENNISSLDDLPRDKLEHILLNHIIQGEWRTFEFEPGYYPTQAKERSSGNSIDLYIDPEGILQVNGDPAFGTSDIESDNGVIHSMVAVIKLPTVFTHLSTNPNLSEMKKLISRKDLSSDFRKVLNDNNLKTLFVPDNDAFDSFFKKHPDWNTIKDIPAAEAEKIIRNHLITDENLVLEDLFENSRITDNIEIQIEKSKFYIKTKNIDVIAVTIPDIQAENGIIHKIDSVILF